MGRRPLGSGDEWVILPDGRRFWGSFGAAGLLVHSPEAGVLLQHRAGYGHFGGTWGLPGGARHHDETPVQAAIREAGEEAGVPADGVRPRFTSVLDLEVWTYTTVVARAHAHFDPVIGDAESIALAWVPIDGVEELPLHPGFAASWPALRGQLETAPVLIIDGANVVGSRPDGWWKDRAAAADRLAGSLQALVDAGVPSAILDLPGDRWWPELVLVLEGEARDASVSGGTVRVERAVADGDSRILELVDELRGVAAAQVTVVTADRALSDAVLARGAKVVGPKTLLELLQP